MEEKTYFDWLKYRIKDLVQAETDPEIKSCLLLAPDLFTLLVSILKDPRLPRELQQTAVSVLQYFLLPTDLIPEAFHGAHGLKDDIYFVALFLKKYQGHSGSFEQYWKGNLPLQEAIFKILNCGARHIDPEIKACFEKALEKVHGNS